MDTSQTPKPPIEPDPRILFAAERNLLAWIRTGLALIGFGFVVARFHLMLREMFLVNPKMPAPSLVWQYAGLALLVLGIAVNLLAIRQHFTLLRKINTGESIFPAPPSPGVFVAGTLALLGLIIAAYLLSL